MKYTTEQEDFWAGAFGNSYIDRNKSDYLLASNIQFFSLWAPMLNLTTALKYSKIYSNRLRILTARIHSLKYLLLLTAGLACTRALGPAWSRPGQMHQ